MLKGSFSLSALRWSDDVLETLARLCQKVFFSAGGDGCSVSRQRKRSRVIAAPLTERIPEDTRRCR